MLRRVPMLAAMDAQHAYPVGRTLRHLVGPYVVEHQVLSMTRIRAHHLDDAKVAPPELLDVRIATLRPGLHWLTWQEADGSSVACVEDFDAGSVRVAITTRAGEFIALEGRLQLMP